MFNTASFRPELAPFLICLSLAGCGTRPPSSPVTVTIFGLGLDAGEQLRRDILDEWTRNTGIHADLIPTLGNSTEQLAQTQRLLNQRARTPDVYVIDVI